MQSIEAIISLMFLVSVVSFVLVAQLDGQRMDDSLYRAQLAEDAWRVLYLRGDFQEFNNSKQATLEADMAEIGEQTSLCIFMGGTIFTNCRGGQASHEIAASLSKTVIYEGRPKAFDFSIGD